VQDGGNLVTGGNFTNNGSFTQNDGTLIFVGTTQIIDGSSTDIFNNITVASGSTTTISSTNQTIKGILKSDGTLNAGGNLTLLSTATQTALIDGDGTGDVLGNVIMQRYLAAGNGYKYISSPFQSATVNEFADDLDLNEDFPTFYENDENDDATGWIIYTTTSNPLNPRQGYAANFGASDAPKTIDATGVVSNGTITGSTLYNRNKTYTQGFNLVGNPYPSPIDWEAVTGWTRTNIDDAIYFFNASEFQYTGHYSSYINGVSSDDIANGIIPSMQGFFVHVSDGSFPVSATFSMNNNVRINDLAPIYHKTSPLEIPLLRLTAKYAGDNASTDAAVIYFDELATKSFDNHFDALKMMNTNEKLPNIYIHAADSTKMSINAIPIPTDSLDAIPLGLALSKDGIIVIKATTIQYLPTNLTYYLADAKTRNIQVIEPNKEYSFSLSAGEYLDRFSIVFSKKDIANTIFSYNGLNAYSNGHKLLVNLNLATGYTGDFVIRNMLGQDIYSTTLTGYGYHELSLPDAAGIYFLSFQSSAGIFSKKVFLSKEQ
jgi:hypothetical protein